MQEAVKRHAEELRRREGVLVQIRVGINSGRGVRSMGSDLRLSRLVLLQSKAEPLPEMEQVARSASQYFGVKLVIAEATPTDYTDAFALIEREKPEGLLVAQSAGSCTKMRVQTPLSHYVR